MPLLLKLWCLILKGEQGPSSQPGKLSQSQVKSFSFLPLHHHQLLTLCSSSHLLLDNAFTASVPQLLLMAPLSWDYPLIIVGKSKTRKVQFPILSYNTSNIALITFTFTWMVTTTLPDTRQAFNVSYAFYKFIIQLFYSYFYHRGEFLRLHTN